jgi:hypothetical protein
MTPDASALLQRLITRVLAEGGDLDQRCVSLLHFDTPLGHARHELGVTRRGLGIRLVEHYAGRGSRLMAAVVAAGIEVRLVRTWPAGRACERTLKRWKKNRALCPLCRARWAGSPTDRAARSCPPVGARPRA